MELLTVTSRNRAAVLARAAAVLRAGGVVAHPTDTVYGLAARADLPRAVAAIHTIKGSADSKPLLTLLPRKAELPRIARVSPLARRLVAHYWPGPLALVLPSRAGSGTVGVRYPAHALSLRLARLTGTSLVTTSANPTGLSAPTSAEEVLQYFAQRRAKPDLVLKLAHTPKSKAALPSTIVDLTGSQPRCIRAGAISWASLQRVLSRLS
jgi:L-threonylcarbamoyladenylate synthase